MFLACITCLQLWGLDPLEDFESFLTIVRKEKGDGSNFLPVVDPLEDQPHLFWVLMSDIQRL